MGQYSFQEVMRQWSRLCGRHNDMMYCERCPLDASKICGIVSELRMEDIKDAEKTIMAWASEHPEPVYPTWAEWLMAIGVISGLFPNGAIDALGNLKTPSPPTSRRSWG